MLFRHVHMRSVLWCACAICHSIALFLRELREVADL